jgi:RNA polymerase sigma-70 factor (ECF subfamily)
VGESDASEHRGPVEDSVLASRAREGDTAAFASLYERHAPAVHRLSLASVHRSQADDVTAEVFARAWSSLGRYRGDGSPFAGWLFGIARHVIADTHRRRYRRPTERLDDTHDPVEEDPTVARLQRLHLDGVLDSLGRRQRRVIELKYFAGLGNEEVAGVLGISAGAVNTLQWRALRQLRSLLEAEPRPANEEAVT